MHDITTLLKRFAAMFIVVLSGCASVGQFGPYNTSSDGEDTKLMLNGYDPVAYFTESRAVRGVASIKSTHDGVTYRFANAANKTLFDKEPLRYAPQYGGFCANGIAYAIPWGGDGDTWRIYDGKLYVFGGASSRNYFEMDRDKNVKLADQYWQSEIKGGGAVSQRYKRLAMRVPHYKTGAELEAEWQAKQLATSPAPTSVTPAPSASK
jgi:YHS domain-containing protein